MAKRSQRIRRQKRIERMKTNEQEAKFVKVVEDNSVMLGRMKDVSLSCDKILQSFNIVEEPISEESPQEESPQVEDVSIVEPTVPVMKAKNVEVEPKEAPKDKLNLKKMTKRKLINLAKDIDVKTTPSMTKANIIRAIEAKQ